MAAALKILLVENSENDAILLSQELDKGGIQARLHRVETREGLDSALEAQDWDIVIADYVLPGFSGMDALKMVKEQRPDLPFIMISQKLEEEIVIDSLKAGAQDYVMKDRLFRLCPAVNQALRFRAMYLEKKKAEIELQKVVSRYHLLAENITDIIWTTDLDQRLTFVSPSITHVLGYGIEEIIGMKLVNLFSSSGFRKIYGAPENVLVRSKYHKKNPADVTDTFEMEVRRKNGTATWIESKITVLSDEKGRPTGFLGVSRDIMERKRKEKEISLLVQAFKQIEEGVVISDHEGIIQFVNKAFTKSSGFPRKKFIGMPISRLDSESNQNLTQQDYLSALRKGKSWRGRLKREKKDGSVCQVHTYLFPVRDEKGKITNFVYIESDITQELKLQDKLIEMQKMEALGTLAGGIAHDFNNILMPIIVNAEILLWDSGKEDAQKVYLDQILEAAKRGKELVKQILSYGRKSAVEKKPIDLVSLVKESLSFLHATLPSTVKIESVVEIKEARIEGNPTQIHQVLMNLCTNAADAVGLQGGRIKVTLTRTEFETKEFLPDNRLKTGLYAWLSVSDSGPGIEPEIMEKMFDPFFSTKDPGKGTGMGLSVARRIVYDHRGAISVDSDAYKGTTFHVYLPLSDGKVQPGKEKTGSLRRGNERILLIDDEDSVVKSIQNMLGKMGYSVTGVTSSQEALDIFKARPDAVDLVITDQVMPKLTGVELAKEIRRIQPDVPLILMTGFSEKISKDESVKLGINAFLMKPVNTRTMTTTIRKVLDRKK